MLASGGCDTEADLSTEESAVEDPCSGFARPPRGRRRFAERAAPLLGGLAAAAGLVVLWRAAGGPGSHGGLWVPSGAASPSYVQLSGLKDDDCEDCTVMGKQGGEFKTAYVTSASHPYKCLNILGTPKNGSVVQVWDCPEDQDLFTKFLIPIGHVGPIRPVEAPDLCLDSPEGFKLQLWSCTDVEQRRSPERVHFLVVAEASTWFRYDHYDLPDEKDVEQMSADNIGDVMHRVEEIGYAGFSIWKGQAWIKGLRTLALSDLHYMGNTDPVIFYLYRPRGDFTIRSAHDPALCVGVEQRGKDPRDAENIHLFRCAGKREYSRLEATRFKLHYASLTELEAERMDRLWRQTEGRGFHPRPSREKKTSQVVVSMTLTNLDYGQLKANPELSDMVADVIKEEVAGAAGYGITADSVTPIFGQGSVKVTSIIHVPESVPVTSVVSRVQGAETESVLKSAVAQRVSQLPGIDKVTTGVVEAQHDGTHAPQAGAAVLSNVRSWLGVILGALLVGLCCLCGFLERGRLRSWWTRMRSRGKESTALSVYKTREPVINIDAPGVWRAGRIVDRARPESAGYDVDLDSTGRRPATLAVGYAPVSE